MSKRFVPQCIVPISPVEATVNEIKRSVAKGHKGVVYPAVPMTLRDVPHINEPHYDTIWATCQDLGVPLCFHAGSSAAIQFPPYTGFTPGLVMAMQAMTRPASTVFVLVNFLFSRILSRYPKLKVVFAESGLAWGAYVLEYADHQFECNRLHREGYKLKPSELFKRQCYLTGWYDRAAIQTRSYVGTGNILWATNFPLATSPWPNSRDYIAHCFQGVPEDERLQITRGNAAKLYKL